MTHVHHLTDQVIGIFADPGEVVAALESAGYTVETIAGKEGHEHLDPTGEEHGLGARLARLASLFGDERMILDRFDEAVQAGKVVIAAKTDEQDPIPAVDIMKEHHGTYLWRFDAGIHVRVAD